MFRFYWPNKNWHQTEACLGLVAVVMSPKVLGEEQRGAVNELFKSFIYIKVTIPQVCY